MKSRVLQITLLPAVLALTVFCTSFTVRAGDIVPVAEKKTEKKKDKAPATGSAASKAKKPTDAVPAPPPDEKTPLKLTVDTKSINRDAFDRVSYAPIIKRTASSVVYVHSSKRVRSQDMSALFSDPRFRRFFDGLGIPTPEEEGSENAPGLGGRGNRNAPGRKGVPRNRAPDEMQQGLGSGVVISADGYILTNNHVIEGADEVKVSIGESNKRYEARVVGRDSFADVAVLKIDAKGLTPAVFGDSEQLQVGDVVLAIGNPFGVGQSVSRGIVSALSRGVGMGPIEDFIQTDAAINPGNSGGALIDTEGRVVGINTAILSRSGGFAGVGFAIPINLVRNIAEQIVNTGRVNRGFLGVAPQDIADEGLAAQFGVEKGAIISEVTLDSPAEKAGLKDGDVITKINNTEIRDSRHLLLTVGQILPETPVTVEYLRDGKKETATVKLGNRPESAESGDDAPLAPKGDIGVLNGVGVGEITAQLRDQLQIPANIKGALITSVDPESPSARQGLREGDIILDLNKKPVTNADEAVRLSEEIKGPQVLVRVWRNGRTTFVAVDESKKE
ncbi:MAG: Do family serine endopeptidase [Verrucomicrobiota bacterium]